MSGPVRLSEAQVELLQVIDSFEADIYLAATQLGKPIWAISNTRNSLLAKGLIRYWDDYDAPMLLTDTGRAALKQSLEKMG